VRNPSILPTRSMVTDKPTGRAVRDRRESAQGQVRGARAPTRQVAGPRERWPHRGALDLDPDAEDPQEVDGSPVSGGLSRIAGRWSHRTPAREQRCPRSLPPRVVPAMGGWAWRARVSWAPVPATPTRRCIVGSQGTLVRRSLPVTVRTANAYQRQVGPSAIAPGAGMMSAVGEVERASGSRSLPGALARDGTIGRSAVVRSS
jgi:hypothetical protein